MDNDYHIVLSESNHIIFELSLFFRWVYVPERISLVIISSYTKESNIKLVVDLKSGIAKVYKVLLR